MEKQTIIDVQFVTIWEEGEVATAARLDLETGIVVDIKMSDTGESYEHLQREYITVPGMKITANVELFPDDEYRILSSDDLEAIRDHVSTIAKSKLGVSAEVKASEWNFLQQFEEYIDFEKELINFDDEGNSSVNMRLTFITNESRAYICLVRHNNDGNTRDLGRQINVSWEEGVRQLSEAPAAVAKLKELTVDLELKPA